MIVKVCGMCDPHNIEQVARLEIDLMGFIFYAGSPRYIGDNRIPTINMDEGVVQRVGVFVNESVDRILSTVAQHRLDLVQLHGDESIEECRELREKGLRVIKAIAIADASDLQTTLRYDGQVDLFLFDTKTPAYGGSGRVFDWSVLAGYTGETPFLLSGGISSDSLAALSSFSHPKWIGVDLNSGFELPPGVKCADLLESFLKTFRSQSFPQ